MKNLGCTRLGKMLPLVTVNLINSDQLWRGGKVMRTAGYNPNEVPAAVQAIYAALRRRGWQSHCRAKVF